MIKKKLLGKQLPSSKSSSSASASASGVKKKGLPKPPPEEDDEEELTDEEEAAVDDEAEEDTEAEAEEEDTEEETPAVKKKANVSKSLKKKGKETGASALEDAFDSVPMNANADDIAAGRYEALVYAIVLQEPDARGQSVRINFHLCHPDYAESNQIAQWFKILDAQGNRVDGGIKALKDTLARLGYEVKFAELEDCFLQITEEKPGVMIKVSYSKDANGNVWQRASVVETCDNEVVQEYKDNVPY